MWRGTAGGRIGLDLKSAMRAIRRSPGAALVIVLSLGLGIGANTAVFSLVDGLLLKSLPVEHPEQLVFLVRHARTAMGREITFSYPQFEQFRDAHIFADICAIRGITLNARAQGSSEVAAGQLVSGGYFSLLGVPAELGRTLRPDDDRPGATPVAVLSHSYWMRRFGSDRSILGKTVWLNRSPFTVVGVIAARFTGLAPGNPQDLWLPIRLETMVSPGKPWLENPTAMQLAIYARLKPGTGADAAEATGAVLWDRMKAPLEAEEEPDEAEIVRESRFGVAPGGRGFSGLVYVHSKTLLILLAVVGVVLLITCVNIAGLLAAQGAKRQKEIAVRLALGADRPGLVRQSLCETLLLGLGGGLAGLLFAHWIRALALPRLPGPFQTLLALPTDGKVLGFTAVISLAAVVLCGLAPALRLTRGDVTAALNESASRRLDTGAWLRPGKVLFAGQFAVSLVLLLGTGLLIRSLANLGSVPLGFQPEHVLVLSVDPALAGYRDERMGRFDEELRERLAAIPGVRSACLALEMPVDGISWPDRLSGGMRGRVMRNWVGPEFFATVGTPVVLGREFTAPDSLQAPQVAILNQTAVRRYFGSKNPIGKRIELVSEPNTPLEIVGVVKDSRYASLVEDAPPLVYTPFPQSPQRSPIFAVRTEGNPEDVAREVRLAVRNLDPNVPVTDVAKFSEWVDGWLSQTRLMAGLLGFFGMLAMLLVAVGLYGLMAYSVGRRRSEMGIRMALGADRGGILRMVLREALWLALAGTAGGIPLAIASTRLLGSYLFVLQPNDPASMGAAVTILLAVTLLAAYLPARRASRLDPMQALRCD